MNSIQQSIQIEQTQPTAATATSNPPTTLDCNFQNKITITKNSLRSPEHNLTPPGMNRDGMVTGVIKDSPRTAAAAPLHRKRRLHYYRDNDCLIDARITGDNVSSPSQFPSNKCGHKRPLPRVGVFGVDARKRINLWNNEVAAIVSSTARFSPKGIHRAACFVLGTDLDQLFPPTSYRIVPPMLTSTGTTLGHLVDQVLCKGEPILAVNVAVAKNTNVNAGTKRPWFKSDAKAKPRTFGEQPLFSVDLLPQFDVGNATIEDNVGTIVTGVVLVCTTTTPTIDGSSSKKFTAIRRGTVSRDSSITLETDCSGSDPDRLLVPKPVISAIEPICHLPASLLYQQKNPESPPLALVPATKSTEGTARMTLPTRTRSSSLLDSLDCVVFGVDRSGTINEWNQKTAELTGINTNDAIGLSLLKDDRISSVLFRASQSNTKNTNSSQAPLNQMLGPLLSEAYEGRSTPLCHLSVIHRHKIPNQSSPMKNRTTCKRWKVNGSEPDKSYHKGKNQEQEEDHELKHLVASISPRYNQEQKVVGAVFLGLDTTKCFTNFRTITTTANELRKLIDTANAPIFGIDQNGNVNEWNEKTAEITGYRKEDAFGCPLVDTFIFPDIQDSVRSILREALNNGKGASNYELEFRTKANEIRHLLVNITPQCDMNNAVVGVVLIAQDVTEAVKRDRAVANMALELRQLIETANAPIFGIDVHGNVNEWNTRMSNITGFAKAKAFGIPLVENFIAESEKEKVWQILEAALAGNETSNYEVEVTSKSGEPVFLLVNATTRRDPDANVIGVVGVAQDVTEDRKQAKALREMQTLRASQEAKVETERNMTAYFAHELRNPLGAIDSALEAMPDNLPESAQSLVSGMQLCTGFMASIMNNLLDVRKMEEGKMRLGRAPISIRSILRNVHKMLSPSVRPGVDFRKLINVKGKDWVLGDAHRIEQVLTNVVSNAIKYTVSGHIQISFEWEGDNLKFICEDTGPGIPISEQARLFQRFVQRGGAPGTGLGLAIAKHIVDLTGGSIRFISNPAVKAGTTCIVLMALPLCKIPDTIAKQNTEIIQEAISVLVIDDIKMNRSMMKRRIKKAIAPNAIIKEAATGEDALLICGREKFDVMVVDQFMEEAGGVMVGTDVVFAMRRMRIDSVIVGCSGNDIGTQFFDAGADMVWKKPIPSNDAIIRDLRTALTKRSDSVN